MNFNFNQSRVKCAKLGFRVHVIKALIGMKEGRRCDDPEIDVLSKAVDYIKALEREVVRLEVLSEHTTVVTNNFNVSGDATEVAEGVARGFLGRLFLGEKS